MMTESYIDTALNAGDTLSRPRAGAPSTPQDLRQDLACALNAVECEAEMQRFLVDLCTPSELRALSERWHVARLLDAGEHSYRDINRLTGVSTTTIGRVARFLNEEPHQGYRAVLDRQKGH